MEGGKNRGGGLRVAIIGAGVSGLAACKQCSEEGLDATVFEGKSRLGGIWRTLYSSTMVQTPKGAHSPIFHGQSPCQPSFLITYLESYARHFGFSDRIQFRSQIVEVHKKVKPEPSRNMGASEFANLRWIGEDGGGELLQSLIAKSQNGQAGDWDGGNVF